MRSYRIALAMAAMLVPCAAMAQSKQAPGAQALPAATAPTAADDAGASSPHAQRSLMGMVMGALIESAEQTARAERHGPPREHAPAPLAARDPVRDARAMEASPPAPSPQAQRSTVQQVAIGSEP